MDKIFRYKDFSAPLDMADKRIMQLLSKACRKNDLALKARSPKRRYIKMGYAAVELLDGLFGEGSAYKILGGSPTMDDIADVMNALNEYADVFRSGI